MPLKPLNPTALFTYLLFSPKWRSLYANGALTLFVYRAINRTSVLVDAYLHTSTDVCPPVDTAQRKDRVRSLCLPAFGVPQSRLGPRNFFILRVFTDYCIWAGVELAGLHIGEVRVQIANIPFQREPTEGEKVRKRPNFTLWGLAPDPLIDRSDSDQLFFCSGPECCLRAKRHRSSPINKGS